MKLPLLLLLLPSAALAAEAQAPRAVVVKSSNLSAYNGVVAGFAAEVRAEIDELTLPEGTEAAEKELAKLAAKKPSLILAVGPNAATAAKRMVSDIPVVFCMVPYFERYGLEGQNVTGIALTNDVGTELATLKAFSSAVKRVGMLHDPRYSAKLLELAKKEAATQGITIVPLEADTEARAEKVLASSKGKIDGLLMVADKTISSSQMVKKLIDFSDEADIPLLALTSTQVKEGALVSVAPNALGIGQQAGRLANRLIEEKVNPGALAVAQPETLELSFNLGTAQKIGASNETALEMFRFAARLGYPVRVYE